MTFGGEKKKKSRIHTRGRQVGGKGGTLTPGFLLLTTPSGTGERRMRKGRSSFHACTGRGWPSRSLGRPQKEVFHVAEKIKKNGCRD